MKWLVRFSLAGVGVAASILAWFVFNVYVDASHPASSVDLVVARGETLSEVADDLLRRGVIRDAFSFRLLARISGQEDAVHAGRYRLPAHLTQAGVLRLLSSGAAQITISVTIPEGFTARQIAQRLQESGVGSAGDYYRAFMSDSIVVDGERTANLEGFLFPDTYSFAAGTSPGDVEHAMTARFLALFPADAAQRARRLHVSIAQLVTIASMVEREAKVDQERPLIAGVYYNRLRLGMPLQVDATVEYALPHYKTELSFADLAVDSPFNTYRHAGLPPTPIANPGRASLEAALFPQASPYLYYVYRGDGRHAFARTLTEHNANVAKYEK